MNQTAYELFLEFVADVGIGKQCVDNMIAQDRRDREANPARFTPRQDGRPFTDHQIVRAFRRWIEEPRQTIAGWTIQELMADPEKMLFALSHFRRAYLWCKWIGYLKRIQEGYGA